MLLLTLTSRLVRVARLDTRPREIAAFRGTPLDASSRFRVDRCFEARVSAHLDIVVSVLSAGLLAASGVEATVGDPARESERRRAADKSAREAAAAAASRASLRGQVSRTTRHTACVRCPHVYDTGVHLRRVEFCPIQGSCAGRGCRLVRTKEEAHPVTRSPSRVVFEAAVAVPRTCKYVQAWRRGRVGRWFQSSVTCPWFSGERARLCPTPVALASFGPPMRCPEPRPAPPCLQETR